MTRVRVKLTDCLDYTFALLTCQALTLTVAANCKQVLTIAIAVFLFNLHINFTNGVGIMLTLIGGVSRSLLRW
jgi:hypothetical protein